MKIVVCIKQVPATQSVSIDSNTGVLIRDGIESKMNPYDLYALETALQIKKSIGAQINVITMGPPTANVILQEAFWLGADEAYLMSDKKFAGADVLATSKTLVQGIKKIGDVDLIICGKQTTDGDTAQVGPSIAEYLNIPHVSWVKELIEVTNKQITIKQELMESIALTVLSYPCLITVEKGIFQPNLPSYNLKKISENKKITTLTFNDCEDQDENNYGLAGSPTQVEKMFNPNNIQKGIKLNSDPSANAQALINKLIELKYIDGGLK